MPDLPKDYITGNPGMDQKIAAQLEKERLVRKHNNRMIKDFHSKLFNPQIKNNKYHVSPIEERTHQDGTIFATKGEMERWDLLLMMQRTGKIKDLKMQVPFELQEGFISRQKEWREVKPITYVADFTYTNISFREGYEGRECVEDCKGAKHVLTKEYTIKRKMFLRKYATYIFFEVYPDET